MALHNQVGAWMLVEGRSQRPAAKPFRISQESIKRLLAESAEERERRYRRRTPSRGT